MNHVNDRALLKQSKRLRGTDRAGQGAQQVLRALLIDDGSALTSEPRPYLEILWQVNPEIHDILSQAPELESARATIQDYLARRQREILSSDSDLHPLKMATVRECIRAMVSIVSPANEELVEMSALEHLWHLARGEPATAPLSNGFLLEFIYLFRGLAGQSNIYDEGEDVLGELPDFLQLSGREAAQRRMEILDAMAASMDHYLTRYPTGLGRRAIRRRELRRARILELLGGSEEDWHDFRWHLTHVIKKPDLLVELIDLSDKELAAIRKAVEHRIPFGITPYYLSLMDTDRSFGQDQAIRAQVIPPPDYVNMLAGLRQHAGRTPPVAPGGGRFHGRAGHLAGRSGHPTLSAHRHPQALQHLLADLRVLPAQLGDRRVHGAWSAGARAQAGAGARLAASPPGGQRGAHHGRRPYGHARR